MLRKSPKRAMAFAPLSTGAAKPSAMKKELKAKKELLFELALSLGYCLEKKSYFKQEFSSSLARRLINRRGNFIYQSTAYFLPGFSRHALRRSRCSQTLSLLHPMQISTRRARQ